VVTLEGLLKFIPSYSVPSLHRLEMVPPHQSFSPQLQSCEVSFVLLGARQHEGREFCLYGLDSSLSFQGVFRFSKGRRLHCDELSVRGDLIRPLVVGPVRRPSVHLLGDLLLRL
jgi:hypothetical protein